jgi:hypothetical protein
MTRTARLLAGVAAIVLIAGAIQRVGADVEQLERHFQQPDDDARPMVRWWWFGPSVTRPELEREMNLMRQGGFGGFEVQATYPLSVDNPSLDIRNVPFLSAEHLDAITFTAAMARQLGLRMDLTLGSGWPYGGPMFSTEEGAGRLLQLPPVRVAAGARTVPFPALPAAQHVAAALLGPVSPIKPGEDAYVPLVLASGVAELPADLRGATGVSFYVSGQTGMKVKRPALGAEGNVIDHYRPIVIAKFIDEIARPAIKATGRDVPYAVFCDSLEVQGEDWTPDFLAQFKRLRGYDLTPKLPALFDDSVPDAAEVRHDWGQTLTDLLNHVFTATFEQLAKELGTRFRMQAYGSPPANLATYAFADLNEGEQGQTFDWQNLHPLRLASSASHLLGRPITSSEAMTWLNSPVFMARPLDMKAAADLHFLQGINQLILHGWPYTPPKVAYPGWAFYAAGVFNEKNPWWNVMPDVTKYLQRVSQMMREGTPANDVALYLPDHDAWAAFRPGSVQMSDLVERQIGGDVMRRIFEAGYNLDVFDDQLLDMRGTVDRGTLAFGDVRYRAVVLPQTDRMPAPTLAKLEAFVRGGGALIAIGHAPTKPPGLLATAADRQAVADVVRRLFRDPGAKGVVVPGASQLGAALSARLRPDVAFASPMPDVGFVHRHTADAEFYFLANTSNQPRASAAVFRVTGKRAEWWDPVTGAIAAASIDRQSPAGASVQVSLPPYGSKLLVFSARTRPAPASRPSRATLPASVDLSRDWAVTFKSANPAGATPGPMRLDALRLWTADADKAYFSGTATYTTSVTVPADRLGQGLAWVLDFGAGAATPMPPPRGPGPVVLEMHASYQSPVREAGLVFVNGVRAGAVWCPPYRVDVTGLLRPGSNDVRVEVSNLAVNDMAGRPLPDYADLTRAFGNRFGMQDMNAIRSMPSGIEGPVRLVPVAPGR